jgi:hypothetical protein
VIRAVAGGFAALAVLLAGCGASSSSASPTTPPSHASTSAPPVSAAAKVITGKLRAAGLHVTNVTVYTETSDPNHLMGRQGGYTSKTAWVDPGAVKAGDAGSPSSDPGGIEWGGGIEVFPTVAGARARLEELRSFKPPFGDGYDYLVGTAILRLSNYLTPPQAHRYDAAFSQAAGS